MHCCRLGCARRTRQRKHQQGRFKETTSWPIWRNRPKSILTEKTWCPTLGRREVGTGVFKKNQFNQAYFVMISLFIKILLLLLLINESYLKLP